MDIVPRRSTKSLAINLVVARAKFQDIWEAFEFVSSGDPTENEAFLSRETGVIHWHSEYADGVEELPSDIGEENKYFSIPHKQDLGLGKRIAIRFAEDFLADDLGKVREIFSRRGAYARFKDLLDERGMLERWYEYEASAQKEAVLGWCAENGVEIDG